MDTFLRLLSVGAFVILILISVGLTCVLLVHILAFLWSEHAWLLPVLVVVGALAWILLALWMKRRQRPSEVGQISAPHPGIRMHAIPVAGGAGLAIAIGYVLMFWFGAPAYHVLVLAIVALGAAAGALRILYLRGALRKRANQRGADSSVSR